MADARRCYCRHRLYTCTSVVDARPCCHSPYICSTVAGARTGLGIAGLLTTGGCSTGAAALQAVLDVLAAPCSFLLRESLGPSPSLRSSGPLFSLKAAEHFLLKAADSVPSLWPSVVSTAACTPRSAVPLVLESKEALQMSSR